MTDTKDMNEQAAPNSEELQALRQDHDRFRLLVENSLDLVVEVTLEGEFLYISPNVRTVLGYTAEELTGTSVFACVHPDDLAHVQEQFALPQGLATCRYHHRDGSWRWLETTGRDFLTPDGQTRSVLIVRDITERKRAEAEWLKLEAHLREIQKLEALGQLAGGIAHDFNNLLAVIIGCTELAVIDAKHPREAVKHLEQVKKASERAKQLVRQILTFSRTQKHERQPLRLQPVITESLELMRHTLPSTVEIDAQLDPDAPIVLADATQIHQVMMNLCTNAAHAMQQRPGKLTVVLKDCIADAAVVATVPQLRPGHYAQITVSDTGHGMDSRTLVHIFEPFFTTKEPGEGTGLGLPVVHGIVREHQGTITVQSKLGEGTRFDIYLPVLPCDAPENEELAKPFPRGGGEHILLVDDEPAVCASLRVLLMRLGYRVTAETNPASALLTFRKNSDDFDLLISDLTMPRMTGIDLAAQILEIRPQFPVLLASGSSGSLTPHQVRQFGVRDLLSKPTSLAVLADSVHQALYGNRDN